MNHSKERFFSSRFIVCRKKNMWPSWYRYTLYYIEHFCILICTRCPEKYGRITNGCNTRWHVWCLHFIVVSKMWTVIAGFNREIFFDDTIILFPTWSWPRSLLPFRDGFPIFDFEHCKRSKCEMREHCTVNSNFHHTLDSLFNCQTLFDIKIMYCILW